MCIVSNVLFTLQCILYAIFDWAFLCVCSVIRLQAKSTFTYVTLCNAHKNVEKWMIFVYFVNLFVEEQAKIRQYYSCCCCRIVDVLGLQNTFVRNSMDRYRFKTLNTCYGTAIPFDVVCFLHFNRWYLVVAAYKHIANMRLQHLVRLTPVTHFHASQSHRCWWRYVQLFHSMNM